jgi:hypothetical protein
MLTAFIIRAMNPAGQYLRDYTSPKLIALMMEAGCTTETSVYFYETTRRSIPEANHIHYRPHLCPLFFEDPF